LLGNEFGGFAALLRLAFTDFTKTKITSDRRFWEVAGRRVRTVSERCCIKGSSRRHRKELRTAPPGVASSATIGSVRRCKQYDRKQSRCYESGPGVRAQLVITRRIASDCCGSEATDHFR